MFRRTLILSGSALKCTLLSSSTPTPFNELFRQPATLSLLRPRFISYYSNGILTVSSIDIAIRLSLRSRLTLIRLALIRNPQFSGEEVSHLLYRYSFLHLLLYKLQSRSSQIFSADTMLPYQYYYSTASVHGFMPDYYPRSVARLVSCYALFE